MAVMTKNVDAVEYLISVGASVNTFDSGGRSPLTNTIHNHIRFIQVCVCVCVRVCVLCERERDS